MDSQKAASQKTTHILLDVSATLIYPFPSFEDYCITFLEEKNVLVDKTAIKKANEEADKALAIHKKKVSIIPNNAVSERIVWSHYQSVRLKNLSAEEKDYPWLEWGYEVYDSYNPSDKWRVYDDVHSTLSQLKSLGYKLIVVSDFGPGLEKILELVQIGGYFDAKFVSTVEGVSKAHSELYQVMLDKLNISPSQTIMIGDNHELDVVMASKLKIPTIWLNRDKKPLPDIFDKEGTMIHSLSEISQYLRQDGDEPAKT